MKLSLPTKMFASLAISAGVVKGQCDLPFSMEMLNALDSTVGPLYCSLPTPELKKFIEFAVDSALAVDPQPTYDFVKTCFPGVLRSFEALLQGVEPSCTASQTAIAPYASISNGIQEGLLSYDTLFCIDPDCDFTNLKQYLGAIILRGNAAIRGGTLEEQGYSVTESFIPTTECLYGLSAGVLDSEIFCSESAPICGDLFLIDVSLHSDKPFEVAVCNDGCEGEFSKLLKVFACGCGDNPFCLPEEDTPVSVAISKHAFDSTKYCSEKAAKKRAKASYCKATKSTKAQKAGKNKRGLRV